jgi:hypothetical protein
MQLSSSGHIMVPVDLDGHRLTALLDTGASISVVNLEATQATLGLTPGDADTPLDGSLAGAAKSTTYKHRLKSLSLEGVAIANPNLRLIPDLMRPQMHGNVATGTSLGNPSIGTGLSDMNLGMDISITCMCTSPTRNVSFTSPERSRRRTPSRLPPGHRRQASYHPLRPNPRPSPTSAFTTAFTGGGRPPLSARFEFAADFSRHCAQIANREPLRLPAPNLG